MLSTISGMAGGIGLFLLGMVLMTDSLKALAGESLRMWMTRFTGQPLKAMLTGIGITAVVQSSTATTMATIGFVSAGVLGFQNAIGVIIGANIGTTSTGWIVALLGLKFSVSGLALPLIGIGALLKLLGKDKLALFGLALAGFGLIFVGIEFLQDAMVGLAGRMSFARLPQGGLLTRLALVIIGLVMTVILQSSSVAVAATLTALAGGTVNYEQAAALVIGQNIGTTATAVLAGLGATASARRTAAVHVLFNLGSAVIAFFVLLPLFVHWVERFGSPQSRTDDALAIAAFHTAFSLTGALVFMPLSRQLAALAIRLVPDRAPPALRHLDQSLHTVPALAIAAAENTVRMGLADTCHLLARRIQGLPAATSGSSGMALEKLLMAVDEYLEKMPVPQSAADQQRLMQLLHLLDHSHVLNDDLQGMEHISALRQQPALLELGMKLAPVLERSAQWLDEGQPLRDDVALELQHVSEWVHDQQSAARRAVVEQAASTQISHAMALEQLAAQRWLERLAKHVTRVAQALGSSDYSAALTNAGDSGAQA